LGGKKKPGKVKKTPGPVGSHLQKDSRKETCGQRGRIGM